MIAFLATCFLFAGSLTGAQEFIGGRIDGEGQRAHWSAGIVDVGPRGAPGVTAVFGATFDGSFNSDTEDEPTSAGFDYGWTPSARRHPAERYSAYREHEPWGRYEDYDGFGYEDYVHPHYSYNREPLAGGYRNGHGYNR